MMSWREPVLGLLSESLLNQVVAASNRALTSWGERWNLDVTVQGRPAEGEAAPAAFFEQEAPVPVRLCWPVELEDTVAQALFASPMSGMVGNSMAARGVRHVMEDCRRVLADAWRVTEWAHAPVDTSVSSSRDHWHACVDLTLTVAGVVLSARVPASRWRLAPERRSRRPLSPEEASAAFARLPSRLRAVVGHADVSVADVAGLQVGDVLLLSRSIREPMSIEIDGRAGPLRASLGLVGTHRAAQFLPINPAQEAHGDH